ncbi:MAG TPA: PRC-barrel domain-containing protein [Coleofasciculaceae cyanobacterium]
MNLFRISDFEPQYRKSFEDADILKFEVLTEQRERVGKVVDILMDDIGQLYYLVVDIGSWLARKFILVAPEQFRIDRQRQQICLVGLTKQQVHNLPMYDDASHSSRTLNQRTITVSQPAYSATGLNSVTPLEASAPLEASVPLEPISIPSQHVGQRNNERRLESEQVSSSHPTFQTATPSTDSKKQPDLPPEITSNVISQQTIPLLEERLIVNQKKRKIGEVVFRKQIETRIIEVPVRRERLIIEQISPELKQLAIVDLSSDQLSDIELAEVASSALETAATHEFISIETARQILSRIAQRSNQDAPRVKLVFEDSQLQADYQGYLRKNLPQQAT